MWLKRAAARVVLLDRQGRIFLVNAEDPIDPYKPAWWEIPGGGIDFGEDSATAAGRELYEETGIEDALEAAAFLGARWWALDDLLASDEPVLPALLREHLPPILAGDIPGSPIDISPVPLD